jgi:hypothetical protein
MKKYRIFISFVCLYLSLYLNSGTAISANSGQTQTLKVDDEKSTEQSNSASDLFYSKFGDPREFIKLDWYEGMDYGMVKRTIKQDKLPLLHEMLKDANYSDSWEKISRLIGYLSKDPNSVTVLLDYFKRDDSWNWQSSETPGTVQWVKDNGKCERKLRGKITSLMFIGMIGGPQANLILRQAVTEQGEEKLSAAWIRDNFLPKPSAFVSKADMITGIRVEAIKGLVFSGDRENYEIVKKLYEPGEATCKSYRESHTFDESMANSSLLHQTLVESMGKHDYISEHSLEAYFELFGDNNNYDDTIVPYEIKYCSLFEEVWNIYQNQVKEYKNNLNRKSNSIK